MPRRSEASPNLLHPAGGDACRPLPAGLHAGGMQAG